MRSKLGTTQSASVVSCGNASGRAKAITLALAPLAAKMPTAESSTTTVAPGGVPSRSSAS
jgi:hypothetical protein